MNSENLDPKLKEVIKLLAELNMHVILAYDEEDESIVMGLVAGDKEYVNYAVASMQGLAEALEGSELLDQEGLPIDPMSEDDGDELADTLVSTLSPGKKKTYLN